MAKKGDASKIGTGSYITAGVLAGTLLVGVFTPVENIPVVGGMAERMGMSEGELGKSFVGLAGESFAMRSATPNYNEEQEVLKVEKSEYISQVDGFGVLGSFTWRGTPSSEDTLFPAKVQTDRTKEQELQEISELQFNTGNQKAFVLDNQKESKIDVSSGIATGSGRIKQDDGLSVYANKKDVKNRALFMDSSVKSSPIFVNLDDKKSEATVATKKGDVFVDKETESNIIGKVDGNTTNTYGTFGQANLETSRVYSGRSISNLGTKPFGQMGFSWLASRVANYSKRAETKATFSSAAFSGEKSSREVVIAKGGVSTVINLSGPGSADTVTRDTQWLLNTQAYFDTCSSAIAGLATEMDDLRLRVFTTLSEMRTLEANYQCDPNNLTTCIPYQGDYYDNNINQQTVNITHYANTRRAYWNARIPTIDPRTGQQNDENLVPLCEKLRADYIIIRDNCGFVYEEGTCFEQDLRVLAYTNIFSDYSQFQDCIQGSAAQGEPNCTLSGAFKWYDCLEYCKTAITGLALEPYMQPQFTEAQLLQQLDLFFGVYNQTSVWQGGGSAFGIYVP